jgi:hypothetical protein
VFPTFEVVGPVNGLAVTLNGEGWSFTEDILTGDIYEIDHGAGTVVGTDGANRYDIFDTAPKFFAFPPGLSSVLVVGTNATLDTTITCRYNLAFEVVHG